MMPVRLLSLLLAGGVIAWLIGRAVAAAEAGGWPDAAPWFALILAAALGYAFALDRFARRKP